VTSQEKNKILMSINSMCSILNFSGKDSLNFLNNLLITDLKILEKNKINYSALCNPKGRIISSLWIYIIEDNTIQLHCPNNIANELETFFKMRKFRLAIDISLTPQNENPSQSTINFFYTHLFQHNLPWIDKNNTERFIPQHVNLDQHDNIMSFTKGCYPGQEIIARIKYLGKIKKRMVLLNDNSKTSLETKGHNLEKVSPIIATNNENKFSMQIITQTPI
jgi:folate-binding protein YgfZ